MNNKDIIKNEDWSLTIWVGGQADGSDTIEAQKKVLKYLENIYEKKGRDQLFRRQVREVLLGKDRHWDGVGRDMSLDFKDDSGKLYAAYQVRVCRTGMNRLLSGNHSHALLAANELADVSYFHRVSLICADAPRYTGKLDVWKNKTLNFTMAAATLDPMRNTPKVRVSQMGTYEHDLIEAGKGLEDNSDPTVVFTKLIPQMCQKNSIYLFGNLDTLEPLRGSKINPNFGEDSHQIRANNNAKP